MHQFYCSIHQAVKELAVRQRTGVCERVAAWQSRQGFPVSPIPTLERGVAILGRHVATARFEDIVFSEMARSAGLIPGWFEYSGDRFATASAFKRSLVRPQLCTKVGKAGPIVITQRIVNVESAINKPLHAISTNSGESLPAWHHALHEKVFGKTLRIDVSRHLQSIGSAAQYYAYYLSWAISHGILFEDFHGGESGDGLDRFTAGVFEPAWERVHNEIGIEPLIVPLPWWDGLQYYTDTPKWEAFGIVTHEKLRAHAA